MTDAIPAISAGVSPLMRSAVTNAPNWAGVASPDMIWDITAAASCWVRSLPSTSVWMPCWMFMGLWFLLLRGLESSGTW